MMNLILAGLGLFALTQNKTPVPTSGPQGSRNILSDGNSFYPQSTTAEREVPAAAPFSDMVDSLQERAVSAVNQITANPSAVFNEVKAMNYDSLLNEVQSIGSAQLARSADQDNVIERQGESPWIDDFGYGGPAKPRTPGVFISPALDVTNFSIVAPAGPASTAPITPVATSTSGVNTLEGRQVLPEVTSTNEFSLARQAQQNALTDARNTLKANAANVKQTISDLGKPQRYMPPAKTAEQLQWEQIVKDNPQLKRFL
jgi:hypothetical protein